MQDICTKEREGMSEDLYGLLGDLGDLGVNGPRASIELFLKKETYGIITFGNLEEIKRKIEFKDILKKLSEKDFDINYFKDFTWKEGHTNHIWRNVHDSVSSPLFHIFGGNERALANILMEKFHRVSKVEFNIEGKKFHFNRSEEE